MDKTEQEIVRRFTGEVPVRLAALAEALGIVVKRSALKPTISGQIEPFNEAPSGYIIKLNRYEAPERQRFTLAHEIAHYLLHRDYIGRGVVDSVMYRSNLHSRKEVEANKLAADIIMPLPLIAQELRDLGGMRNEITAAVLAEKFKVSLPAMKIRLGL